MSDLKMVGKCRVKFGRWNRWTGEGKTGYAMHRYNDDSRIVDNVTEKEFKSRREQLEPLRGLYDLREAFQPERVSHGTIQDARAEIGRADSDDVKTLLQLFANEERVSVRHVLKKKLAQFGEIVEI